MKCFLENYGISMIIAFCIMFLIMMLSPIGTNINNSLINAKGSIETADNQLNNHANDSIDTLSGQGSQTCSVKIDGEEVANITRGNIYKLSNTEFGAGYIDTNNNNDIYKDGQNIRVLSDMNLMTIDSIHVTGSGGIIQLVRSYGYGFGGTGTYLLNGQPPTDFTGALTYGLMLAKVNYFNSHNGVLNPFKAPNDANGFDNGNYNMTFTDASHFNYHNRPGMAALQRYNFPEEELGTEYVICPYLIVNYKDGSTKTIWADNYGTQVRSASQVAKLLLERGDAEAEGWSQDTIDFVRSYIVD